MGRNHAARVPRRPAIKTIHKITEAARHVLFTAVLAGIKQYITAAIVLAGEQLTPQALSALFKDYLQSQADLEQAHRDVAAKQQARDAALAAVQAVLPSLEKYVSGSYGVGSAAFTTFGFTAPKKPVKPARVKAAAATKATKTRKAHAAALQAPVAESPAPVVQPVAAPAPQPKS